MNEKLKKLREKQVLRRQLLAQQLGARGPNELSSLLKSKSEREGFPKRDNEADDKQDGEDGEPGKLEEEFPLEESEYKDSSTFLKGTQSANPHNDYCQHFVDTGQRPQNFIRDAGLADRFEEYPKLRELIRLKDELISKTNTPPMYLHCDLETFDLADLGCQFDVILVEAPLQEYQRTQGMHFKKYWTWDEIMNLDIPQVAASRSFIFIWCGSGEGLNRGRECLKLWGFRRCEDICWVKTNMRKIGHNKHLEQSAVFQRTKEHCLMGIKGTVKRNQDGDFIHANIDIDLIISDEPEYGSPEKPVEIFHIIEHFCLGRRRLHLFGRDQTVRPGWLSVGPDLTHSNFDRDTYLSYFLPSNGGLTTGCTEVIESLRPKSPPPKKPGSGPGGSGKHPQRSGSKSNFRAGSASNR